MSSKGHSKSNAKREKKRLYQFFQRQRLGIEEFNNLEIE